MLLAELPELGQLNRGEVAKARWGRADRQRQRQEEREMRNVCSSVDGTEGVLYGGNRRNASQPKTEEFLSAPADQRQAKESGAGRGVEEPVSHAQHND